MAIQDDFSIATNGDIRHTSGTTRYPVIEFHRWIGDLLDNESSVGDDNADITTNTISERSTDNIITLNSPYNIDDTAAEFFYDGSISQSDGDTLYSSLVVVGSVYGTTTLQVVQNNTLYDGASPFWGTGINADAANNIICRMLIKTRDAGADIDGKRIRVFAREWGSSFAEYESTMGLGNSTAAIFTNEDLNNTTLSGTVSGWTGITNTEGYQGIDLNNGNGTRYYYSEWDRNIYSINQLYERSKYLSMRGSAETLYGLPGELFRGITHQWTYDNELSGPFSQNEILSWGTGVTAGTGALLALDDQGATGEMWIQLLTGVPPTDGLTITGVTSSATCDVDGSPTSRSIPSVYLGQSTGSSIIGAFGVGIESADLTNSDKLFDLTNIQQQPPNNATFTFYGLVSGEDRVLVTADNGSGGIDFDQMTLNTTLAGAAETTVDVGTGNIPVDTPQTGTLRVTLDNGSNKYVPYTSHNSDDNFTIGSTDFTSPLDATAANGLFLSYIDKLASAVSETFTLVYDSDRVFYCRGRDGGGTPIKTFESSASYGSGGGSVTMIRTSDA